MTNEPINDDDDDDVDIVEDEEGDGAGWSPLCWDFAHAMDHMRLRHIKTKVDFVTAEREFRALLEDFLPRVVSPEDVESNLGLEFRRRIAEEILSNTVYCDIPFETCQRIWNEVVELGFTNIEVRSTMTHFFAMDCHRCGQIDIGLGVLDELIAELERLRAQPDLPKNAARYYRHELKQLRKRRDELAASRGQNR